MATSRDSFGSNVAATSPQSVLDAASRYQAYQNYSQYYQNGNGANIYNYPQQPHQPKQLQEQQQQQLQQAYIRHVSAFQPTGYTPSAVAPNSQQPAEVLQQKETPARKSKKRSVSSLMEKEGSHADLGSNDFKKKEEFEKLVKARTDKLLSDGPVYAVSIWLYKLMHIYKI